MSISQVKEDYKSILVTEVAREREKKRGREQGIFGELQAHQGAIVCVHMCVYLCTCTKGQLNAKRDKIMELPFFKKIFFNYS